MNNLQRSISTTAQLRKAKKKQLTRISDQRIRQIILAAPRPVFANCPKPIFNAQFDPRGQRP